MGLGARDSTNGRSPTAPTGRRPTQSGQSGSDFTPAPVKSGAAAALHGPSCAATTDGRPVVPSPHRAVARRGHGLTATIGRSRCATQPEAGILAAPLIIAAVLAVGSCPSAARTEPDNLSAPGDFLTVVANQTGLPAPRWTASGIPRLKGFTAAAAETNQRRRDEGRLRQHQPEPKLSTDFLRDVFGPGLIGFFYKCENISADTNQYWFTIASGDPAQIDKLCDPATQYPVVYDAQQHLLARRTVHLHRPVRPY